MIGNGITSCREDQNVSEKRQIIMVKRTQVSLVLSGIVSIQI